MSVKTEPCLCRCVLLDQGSPERISFPTSSPHLTSSSAKPLLSCVSSRPRGKDIHLFGERTQSPKADPSSREDTESDLRILHCLCTVSTSVCCYKSLHENGDKCVSLSPQPQPSSPLPHPFCLSISTPDLAGSRREA